MALLQITLHDVHAVIERGVLALQGADLGRCKRLNVILGERRPEKTAEKAVQLRTVRLHQGELVGGHHGFPTFL